MNINKRCCVSIDSTESVWGLLVQKRFLMTSLETLPQENGFSERIKSFFRKHFEYDDAYSNELVAEISFSFDFINSLNFPEIGGKDI